MKKDISFKVVLCWYKYIFTSQLIIWILSSAIYLFISSTIFFSSSFFIFSLTYIFLFWILILSVLCIENIPCQSLFLHNLEHHLFKFCAKTLLWIYSLNPVPKSLVISILNVLCIGFLGTIWNMHTNKTSSCLSWEDMWSRCIHSRMVRKTGKWD